MTLFSKSSVKRETKRMDDVPSLEVKLRNSDKGNGDLSTQEDYVGRLMF